jgi:hypothetical protein
MKIGRGVAGFLALSLCVVAVRRADATMLLPADFAQMVNESQLVVHARIVDVRGALVDARRSIESVITVEVLTPLKGAAVEELVFRVPGGRVGRYRRIVVGAPIFKPGEEVVLFLKGRAPAIPMPFGLSQGVYRVSRATGGANLGTVNADLRANSITPQPFTLFTTESRLTTSLLGEVRVGFVVTRRITVEGRLGYSRPTLETSVSADAESAAPVTVVERIDQYAIDAGVVIGLDEMRFGRWVPYVAAGAGYLRQLHEGLVAIDQGHVYHLGGGVKTDLMTRNRGVVRAAGLRADARLYLLSGGIALDDGIVNQGTMTAGVFIQF